MQIEKFIETNNYGYYTCDPLEGYIYTNVFEKSFCDSLKNHVEKILKFTNKSTFYTNNAKFNYNNQVKTLVSNKEVSREQSVIHDLFFLPNYTYQTVDTIKKFESETISNYVSPIFQKAFETFRNLPYINDTKDDYVITRCHLNYLPYLQMLSLHTDGGAAMFKGNHYYARMLSLTFYLYDHVPNLGGEFWSINGFTYKPKYNSALCILNGNRTEHGVTMNMNTEPRLAFTIRMSHKDDLFLPGHPDKFLYDVSNLTV